MGAWLFTPFIHRIPLVGTCLVIISARIIIIYESAKSAHEVPYAPRKMATHHHSYYSSSSVTLNDLTRYCREGLYDELRYALYYEKEISVHIAGRTHRGNTLLHEAVESGQPDIVQLLLLHGFSPNVRAKGGVTPLHLAVAKGYVGCVKALLEGDADVMLRDDLGQDAFTKAERSKKKDILLRLLASKGW